MELDADLEGRSREALAEEVRKLRAAIRAHRDSGGMNEPMPCGAASGL